MPRTSPSPGTDLCPLNLGLVFRFSLALALPLAPVLAVLITRSIVITLPVLITLFIVITLPVLITLFIVITLPVLITLSIVITLATTLAAV